MLISPNAIPLSCQPGFISTHLCCCRGLSLRGCEDIDDTAVLILSKYTAAARQSLLQRFSSMEVASSSTADTAQPAAGSPSEAALPAVPGYRYSYRYISLQRTLLGNTLLGMRQAAAPNYPHKQPVLDSETGAEHSQGSNSAEREQQQQRSSLHTGKPCCCCAC